MCVGADVAERWTEGVSAQMLWTFREHFIEITYWDRFPSVHMREGREYAIMQIYLYPHPLWASKAM